VFQGTIVITIITRQIVAGRQEGAFQKKEVQKWLLECAKRQEVDLAHLPVQWYT
jgi:hypothetical protein